MDLEKYWYEASPFIYTVAGGYFLGTAHSGIMTLSSLILISAGGTITAMRRRHSLKARAALAKSSTATRAMRRAA